MIVERLYRGLKKENGATSLHCLTHASKMVDYMYNNNFRNVRISLSLCHCEDYVDLNNNNHLLQL